MIYRVFSKQNEALEFADRFTQFHVFATELNSDGKRIEFRSLSDHDGLIERYKSKNLDGILELQNKTPVWNDETQSYVLNFHGRVTQVV